MLGLNMISATTRAMAIGLILLFIHAQINETPIRILTFELTSDTSVAILVVWGGLVLVSALTTAVSTYAGEVIALSISRRAMERSLQKALRVVVCGQHERISLFEGKEARIHIRTVLMGDTMYLLRAVLLATGSALPLLILLVAASVLFYLNAILTIIILALLVVYAMPLYSLNANMVSNSRTFEESRQKRAGLLGLLLHYASQTQCPGVSEPFWVSLFKNNPPNNTMMNAWSSMILSRRKVGFLQDVFLGIVLLAILLTYGLFLANKPQSWALLLMYIIALRYVVSSLGSTATILTGFNRFLPQLQRLMNFVEYDSPRILKPPAALKPSSTHWTIQTKNPTLPDSNTSVKLETGDVAFCFFPGSLDSTSLGLFCNRLTGQTPPGHDVIDQFFFCGHVRQPPPISIGSVMAGCPTPSEELLERIRGHLKNWNLLDEVKRIPGEFNAILTASMFTTLSPVLQLTMFFMPGFLAMRESFIISWHALAALNPTDRSAVMKILSNKVVFLLSSTIVPALPESVDYSIVFNNDGICGIGDAAWHGSIDWDQFREDKQNESANQTIDENDEIMADDI